MCDDPHAMHEPAEGLADFEPAVPIMLEPVDSVELLSLMDNVTDVFMPDQGPARRLSARGGQQVPMLDAPVLEGARRSMPRWPNPADIEVIVCSHGHFDHTTGLSGLIGQLGRANVPVLMDAISCWFSESTVQELFRTRM